MAGAAVALAFVSVAVDKPVAQWLALNFGWTFTGGAEGASAMLGVIAGSMITIAGVVFSMTLVALSLRGRILRVGYELKRAQHTVRRATDEVTRERGLSTPQYAVLDALDRDPGLHGAALARPCFVTPQTMNQLLQRLERAGLVLRASDPTHGRRLVYTLSESGAGLLAAMTASMDAVQRRSRGLTRVAGARRIGEAVAARMNCRAGSRSPLARSV